MVLRFTAMHDAMITPPPPTPQHTLWLINRPLFCPFSCAGIPSDMAGMSSTSVAVSMMFGERPQEEVRGKIVFFVAFGVVERARVTGGCAVLGASIWRGGGKLAGGTYVLYHSVRKFKHAFDSCVG